MTGPGHDVLAMDMKAAVLLLAEQGVPVRVEPTSAPSGDGVVARWRVARQSTNGGEHRVLVVVPEIEGRVKCTDRTPNR